MTKKDDQIICCIPNSVATRICKHNGFSKQAQTLRVIDPIYIRWRRRGDVEVDEKFRQIIPYVVVMRRRQDGEAEYLSYTRTAKGGEARLHSKMSIGVGGHMEHFDSDFTTAMWREVALEEINMRSGKSTVTLEDLGLTPAHMHFCGTILMNDNAVDRVHCGVVYVIELQKAGNLVPTTQDTGLASIEWVTADVLTANIERMEAWSAEIIKTGMRHATTPVFPMEPGGTMARVKWHSTRGVIAYPSRGGVSYDPIECDNETELGMKMTRKFAELRLGRSLES